MESSIQDGDMHSKSEEAMSEVLRNPSFGRFYGHDDFFDSFASGRVLQHLESADETMFLPVSVKE